MAKIKLPSYIKEGSGRMEDAVLVSRGGSSYMMVYRKPKESSTEGQVAVRNAFHSVVADWKFLTGIVREAWNMSSGESPVTGYNLFIGQNIQRRRAGEPILLCPGMGEEILMNFTAAPGKSSGEINCEFLPPEAGSHVSIFARKAPMMMS